MSRSIKAVREELFQLTCQLTSLTIRVANPDQAVLDRKQELRDKIASLKAQYPNWYKVVGAKK